MPELPLSPYLLAALFFLVALAYSSVGLGGGTSYTALLSICGLSHLLIPTIALSLNLVVTAAGSVAYVRRGHLRMRLVLPFFISSIPCSYVGGRLPVERDVFEWLLLATLVAVALRIYIWPGASGRFDLRGARAIALSLLIGSVLGLVAGIVGNGGGIYLVPMIILLGLGTEKEAAAAGSLFILVNSAAALIGRFEQHPVPLLFLAPLAGAALVGGMLGSWFGAGPLKPQVMQKILGGIVLVAIVLLVRRIAFG